MPNQSSDTNNQMWVNQVIHKYNHLYSTIGYCWWCVAVFAVVKKKIQIVICPKGWKNAYFVYVYRVQCVCVCVYRVSNNSIAIDTQHFITFMQFFQNHATAYICLIIQDLDITRYHKHLDVYILCTRMVGKFTISNVLCFLGSVGSRMMYRARRN